MQLPPPVHGASMMNLYVKNSDLLKSKYKTRILELNFITKIDQIGEFSVMKIILLLNFIIKLFFELLFYRPNLVYYTLSPSGGAFLRDAFLIFIIKIFRIKRVYHLHGKGIKSNTDKSKFLKLIYKFTFKNAFVIHLSKLLLYDIEDVYFGKPFILANGTKNGVPNFVRPKIDKIRFIYLSNLDITKGIKIFIESLIELYKLNSNFEARIIGNNSFNFTIDDAKKMICDNNLGQVIKILGPLYNEEKHKELELSSVFVLPTYYKNECFPLSIIEAMQYGNAVISSNEGAISELVVNGVNGFVLNDLNLKSLTEKLLFCVNNVNKVNQMQKNNIIKYKEKYTIQIFEKKLDQIFSKIFDNYA